MKTSDSLIGRWTTDPSDFDSLREYGRVSLVFSDDGSLVYIIHSEDKDQIINLTYRVNGTNLITDQPSERSEECSRFTFTPEGHLVLEYGGVQSRYVRVREDTSGRTS